jgi:rubrerythrin
MKSESVRELFEDVLEQETSIIKVYMELVSETKNEKIREILNRIISDESRHANNARRMLEILKE